MKIKSSVLIKNNQIIIIIIILKAKKPARLRNNNNWNNQSFVPSDKYCISVFEWMQVITMIIKS